MQPLLFSSICSGQRGVGKGVDWDVDSGWIYTTVPTVGWVMQWYQPPFQGEDPFYLNACFAHFNKQFTTFSTMLFEMCPEHFTRFLELYSSFHTERTHRTHLRCYSWNPQQLCRRRGVSKNCLSSARRYSYSHMREIFKPRTKETRSLHELGRAFVFTRLVHVKHCFVLHPFGNVSILKPDNQTFGTT